MQILILQKRRVDAENQNVPRVEAGINIVKILERAHEKPRANQHHRRKRHLNDHERLAEMKAATRVGSAPRQSRSIFLKRRRQAESHGAVGRSKAEEDAREN